MCIWQRQKDCVVVVPIQQEVTSINFAWTTQYIVVRCIELINCLSEKKANFSLFVEYLMSKSANGAKTFTIELVSFRSFMSLYRFYHLKQRKYRFMVYICLSSLPIWMSFDGSWLISNDSSPSLPPRSMVGGQECGRFTNVHILTFDQRFCSVMGHGRHLFWRLYLAGPHKLTNCVGGGLVAATDLIRVNDAGRPPALLTRSVIAVPHDEVHMCICECVREVKGSKNPSISLPLCRPVHATKNNNNNIGHTIACY